MTTFLPSRHGFHFRNYWPPGTPALSVDTPVGKVAVGDASNGLCGGMTFSAADLFVARRYPPPDTQPPLDRLRLNYLTERLLASWNIPGGVMTYYYWMSTPSHDTLLGTRPGLARMTIQDQIPQITRELDEGSPCTLGLVTVQSSDPKDLSKCHQVLAYAYWWNGSQIVLRVYDPNQPDDDQVTISLDTSRPGVSKHVNHNVALGGRPIRGFFFVKYTPRYPRVIAGGNWVGEPPDSVSLLNPAIVSLLLS